MIALRKENIVKIFIDKDHYLSLPQPKLEKALKKPQEGDTLIIYSLDRLNRNIHFVSILEKIDTTNMSEHMIIKVLETLSELNIAINK